MSFEWEEHRKRGIDEALKGHLSSVMSACGDCVEIR
jgi:hypothetical protein